MAVHLVISARHGGLYNHYLIGAVSGSSLIWTTHIILTYRVTHQVVRNLPLTSISQLRTSYMTTVELLSSATTSTGGYISNSQSTVIALRISEDRILRSKFYSTEFYSQFAYSLYEIVKKTFYAAAIPS